MDKHQLITSVKDLAEDLGRTPTLMEFQQKHKGAKCGVEREYRTYHSLLEAAELVPLRQQKLTNKIFQVDIKEHLSQFEPKESVPHPPYESMAIISDIHWPFENQRVIDRFLEWVGDMKPKWVIIDGDAWDMYCHSRFPKSQNIFTPIEEENLAKSKNIEFWKEISKRCPDSTKVQMMGNHDIRPIKQTMQSMPAIEHWVTKYMAELFSFEGVQTIMDHRQELQIGDVLIFHGHSATLGAHRDFTLYNTINGHTHKAGVVFRRIRGQTLWEMNCGLAGDPESKGLSYTPQRTTIWTPAFGALDKDGPRVIIV